MRCHLVAAFFACSQCSDLQDSDETEAVVEYENLIFGNVPIEEKAHKFDALLAYCKLDTKVMVILFFQELKALI